MKWKSNIEQEAMDAAPENRSVPTDNEWKALEMALGMTQTEADSIAEERIRGFN